MPAWRIARLGATADFYHGLLADVLYGLTVWLGAFLLFQLQPIAAKTLLPWFGGSAAIWSLCLVFFQGVLLFGYVYADWSDRRLARARQTRVHLALVAVSAIWLLASGLLDWKPRGTGDPALGILTVLTATIGLPYFVLSTTGPLLQAWYRERAHGGIPYRFYALSNVGSLLALVTYPIAVEPFLTRHTQAVVWASAYLVYAGLYMKIAINRRSDAGPNPTRPGSERSDAASPLSIVDSRPSDQQSLFNGRSEIINATVSLVAAPPGRGLYLFWIALAAVASLLLVSITSHLSQNVAPVPLLWVLPLALYLLTFVFAFGHERWYWRSATLPLAAVAIGGMAALRYGDLALPNLSLTIGAFLLGLFVCCLFFHGELAQSKPDPRYLTSFYVASAFGGAAASLFAGLVAPRVFTGNDEFPTALLGAGVLAVVVLGRAIGARVRRWWWHLLWVPPAALAVVVLGVEIRNGMVEERGTARLAVRNFYGALRVFDTDGTGDAHYRQLVHGSIIHSAQNLDSRHRCDPLTYYAPETGIGRLFAQWNRPLARVGVMGLGSGTLAAYARPGDYYRFYEINPLVETLAHTEFSYLTCSSHVDVVLGDARLSLERDPPQQLDVLVMDAFSGDSIPIHLLTKEAFTLYFRHLKEEGVLAVHISNRYADLEPVVRRLATALDKQILVIDTLPDDDRMVYAASWVLLARPGGILDDPGLSAGAAGADDSANDRPVWTDDYSSIWRVVKWREATSDK